MRALRILIIAGNTSKTKKTRKRVENARSIKRVPVLQRRTAKRSLHQLSCIRSTQVFFSVSIAMSSPLDEVVRLAPYGGPLRRSSTTSICLRRKDQVHSQRRSGSKANSQWDFGASKPSTTRSNMFLLPTQNTTSSSSAGLTKSVSLKSCLSVGSMDEPYKKKTVAMKKNVSFDKISIRGHPITLGDNPSVSQGPPVSLGWYDEETCDTTTLPLEEYEEQRPDRRSKNNIVLSRNMRESLLRDIGGATRTEMAKATREANRVKKERLQTVTRIQKGGDQQQLAMEMAKRKVQRLVGAKKSFKEENEELWKQAARVAGAKSLSSIPETSQSLPVFRGRVAQQGSMKNAAW